MFFTVLLAISLLVLVPSAWLAGRGQSSLLHRVTVALVLAGLAVVPVLPTLALPITVARGETEWVVVDEHGHEAHSTHREPDGPIDGLVVALTWLVLLIHGVRTLRMPRSRGPTAVWREIRDDAILLRVQGLARALRVAPPRVFEVGLLGNELHAATGGLAARVLLLSSGLAVRLPTQQVDAILAHELAHVAHCDVLRRLVGHSLWFLAVVFCSSFLPLPGSLALLVAGLGLVNTVSSQLAELRADRAAGRLVGFANMASALDKVHHGNLQGESWPVAHAVASHPALVVRAWHLRRAAGDADHIAVDDAQVARCRRARAFVLCLWTLVVGAVLAMAATGWEGLALAVGVSLAALPLLPALKLWRELRAAHQLRPGSVRRWWLARWPLLVLVAAAWLAVVGLHFAASWWWHPLAVAIGLCGVEMVWRLRVGPLRRELDDLLARHEFRGYLDACYRLAPGLRAQPEQRVQECLARAALGEPGAADGLLAIVREHPQALYALTWAVVVLRAHDAPRAVSLARDLVAALPGNAMAEGVLANTLRQAGEHEEAWQRIGRVIERLPRVGRFRAVASRIAMARGDRATAERELLVAERLAPTDLATLLARADFDLQTGAVGAQAALDLARVAAGRSPLEFQMPEVELLAQRCGTGRERPGRSGRGD